VQQTNINGESLSLKVNPEPSAVPVCPCY